MPNRISDEAAILEDSQNNPMEYDEEENVFEFEMDSSEFWEDRILEQQELEDFEGDLQNLCYDDYDYDFGDAYS